jgi:O-acetyl-ADP-ribose deacetylase (regulator of RNase III)
VEEAAEVALQSVIERTENLQNVRLVRFVLFSEEDLEVYENVLSRLV